MVSQEIFAFRYREKFHLSEQDLMNEPLEALNRAKLIWHLDSVNANVEAERQQFNSGT